MDIMGVSHTKEQLTQDGEIHDFLTTYFPKEWNDAGDDILWELGQGLGEYRSQALKEQLLNELTIVPKDLPNGYEFNLTYTQLLTLIHFYDLKTFSGILNSGFNEIHWNLHEAWYDEWGYSEDTGDEISRVFNNFIESVENSTLGDRRDNTQKFERIIKDLGFERNYGNLWWDKNGNRVKKKCILDYKTSNLMREWLH